MVEISLGKLMRHLSAISCSPAQKAFSRRTLVLRPAMRIERGIIRDMEYRHFCAAKNIHVLNAG